MNDAVHLLSWICMGGRMRRLKAATLINGNVNNYRALAHRAQHPTADQFGSARARDKHRTDYDVRRKYLLLDGVDRREPGTNAPFGQFLQLAKPGYRTVEDCDLGTQTDRHPCRIR